MKTLIDSSRAHQLLSILITQAMVSGKTDQTFISIACDEMHITDRRSHGKNLKITIITEWREHDEEYDYEQSHFNPK